MDTNARNPEPVRTLATGSTVRPPPADSVLPTQAATPADPPRLDPDENPTRLAATGRPSVLAVPGRFGRYELLSEIAHGGMGVVYKARDPLLNRAVAIKTLRAGTLASGEELQRFYREARAAAQLQHPNIVPIHEVGHHEGLHYFSMGFVGGGTLAGRREQFQDQPRAIAGLMAKVARAVHFAHEKGVLHRDLKPSNILLDERGEPLVSDFGLAKLLDSDLELTVTGAVLGTPAYMAPEQTSGETAKISARTDVWALGVMLYELLTGQRPFKGNTKEVLAKNVLSSDPPPLRKLRPKLDRPLETVVLKCLEKEPARRYQTAVELAEDLERWLKGEPVRARPTPSVERVRRWLRRHPGYLTAAGVLVGVAGLATAAVLGIGRDMGLAGSVPLRPVHLVTEPPGARIAIVPIDPVTGELRGEHSVIPAGRTPVALDLPPGEYFAEVELNGQLHQVFRTVPPAGAVPGIHRHRQWLEHPDGSVELAGIHLPPLHVTDGMAYFAGGEFEMGHPRLMKFKPHATDVAPFYLDVSEVTVGQFRRVMESLPPPLQAQAADNHAVNWVTYHEALACAEKIGKRLMMESEYEFAATLGGKRQLPWGDDFHLIAEWPLGPVKAPVFDQLPTQPPVFGLYSNVAEWTSSWPVLHPASDVTNLPDGYRAMRIIRGGPYSVLVRKDNPREWALGPCWRHAIYMGSRHEGLGFRCARSAKPLFLHLEPD